MSENSSEHDETTDSPKTKKKWYQEKGFWFGFWGWFVGNGSVYWVVSKTLMKHSIYQGDGSWEQIGILSVGTVNSILLLLNIGALIYFAFKKRGIALGMLAAFGCSLAVVVLLGIFLRVFCFFIVKVI